MTDIEKTIYDRELSLMNPEIRSSLEKLRELIADDFQEIGSSGERYDKQHVLDTLPQSAQTSSVIFNVSDFVTKVLADDVILTTFKTDKVLSDNSHRISLRSSLWRNNGGRWQMVFHQGTLVANTEK